MKIRAWHIGRTRIKAAQILSQGLGFEVKPEDIKPATGAWRTNWRLDVYRWELFTKDEMGRPIVAGCWETLTEFNKHAGKNGFHMHHGEIYINGLPPK